jgi:hypothetical protein
MIMLYSGPITAMSELRSAMHDPYSTIMKKLLFVLSSRLILFVLIQAMIASFLWSWKETVKYWPLTATLANLISIMILNLLLKNEQSTLFSLLRFNKKNIKTDIFWFLLLAVISVPLAIGPSLGLSQIFWGNTEYYHQVLFQPVNKTLLSILALAYPITTGLAELPTYFGYAMPKLKNEMRSPWQIVMLPVLAFSIQHCTLPLIFEAKFIVFRGVMYFLFTLVYGITLYYRPSLLPWLVILQMLIYLLPMMMLLKQ